MSVERKLDRSGGKFEAVSNTGSALRESTSIYPDSQEIRALTNFIRISRLTCSHIVVALSSLWCASSAIAYTTNTCDEQWFVPTPGKEFNGTSGVYDGSVGAFTLKREQDSCDRHDVKVLGWRDHQQTEGFAIVDGKGYFINQYRSGLAPYCGMTGDGIIDPQCLLPKPLRHVENQYHNHYYQVATGADLKLLALGRADLDRMLRIDKGGFWDIPAYATDGTSVFLITHPSDGGNNDTVLRIREADVETFHRVVPEGSQNTDAWSADRTHVYFYGRPVPGMNPNLALKLVGDESALTYFVVNDSRVFQIDFDEIKARPDMGPSLRFTHSGFEDGKQRYGRDGRKSQ